MTPLFITLALLLAVVIGYAIAEFKARAAKRREIDWQQMAEELEQEEYIVVVHGWHVDSRGFTVKRILADDMADARNQAIILADKRRSTFCSTDFVVVPVQGVR